MTIENIFGNTVYRGRLVLIVDGVEDTVPSHEDIQAYKDIDKSSSISLCEYISDRESG